MRLTRDTAALPVDTRAKPAPIAVVRSWAFSCPGLRVFGSHSWSAAGANDSPETVNPKYVWPPEWEERFRFTHPSNALPMRSLTCSAMVLNGHAFGRANRALRRVQWPGWAGHQASLIRVHLG